MKRKYVAFRDVPKAMGYRNWDELNAFCCDLWEDMNFCKDGETRWYHFTDENGEACYTLKH